MRRDRLKVELRHVAARLFLALLALRITGGSALAQDNVRGGSEPIVSSIDPSKLAYDVVEVHVPAVPDCRWSWVAYR
jgi:hypothetical protein